MRVKLQLKKLMNIKLIDLLAEIINFKKHTKPRSQEKKREKEIVLQNLYNFFEGREKKLLMLLKAKQSF